MIGPVKTAAVYVADQEAALEFYVSKRGFELRRSTAMTPETRWLEVAPPGARPAWWSAREP